VRGSARGSEHLQRIYTAYVHSRRTVHHQFADPPTRRRRLLQSMTRETVAENHVGDLGVGTNNGILVEYEWSVSTGWVPIMAF
jgi:hypothetical protein